jgi:hypothetical protein
MEFLSDDEVPDVIVSGIGAILYAERRKKRETDHKTRLFTPVSKVMTSTNYGGTTVVVLVRDGDVYRTLCRLHSPSLLKGCALRLQFIGYLVATIYFVASLVWEEKWLRLRSLCCPTRSFLALVNAGNFRYGLRPFLAEYFEKAMTVANSMEPLCDRKCGRGCGHYPVYLLE